MCQSICNIRINVRYKDWLRIIFQVFTFEADEREGDSEKEGEGKRERDREEGAEP